MPSPHHRRAAAFFFLTGFLLPQVYGFSNAGARPRTDEPSKSICARMSSARALFAPTTRSSSTVCRAVRFNGMKIPSFNRKTKNDPVPTEAKEPESNIKLGASIGNLKSVLDSVNQSVAQIVNLDSKKQEEVVKTPPKPKGPVELLASTFQRGAASTAIQSAPTVKPTTTNDTALAFLNRMKSTFASTSSETPMTMKKKGTQAPAKKGSMKNSPVKSVQSPMHPTGQMQKQVEALQVDLQQNVLKRKERVMETWSEFQQTLSEATAEIKTTVDGTVKTTQQVLEKVKYIPQRVQETTKTTKVTTQDAVKMTQQVVNEIKTIPQRAQKATERNVAAADSQPVAPTSFSYKSSDSWKELSADAMAKTGKFMQWAAKEAAEIAAKAASSSKEGATDRQVDDDAPAVALMEHQSSMSTMGMEEEVIEALMAAEAELKALNVPAQEESAPTSMTYPVVQALEDTSFELEVEEALLAAEAALDDLNDSVSPSKN